MKPEGLRGRTAIITGSVIQGGVTGTLSQALITAGANVVVATVPTSVRRLVEQALGAYGRIDIAVNQGDPGAMSQAMRYEIPPMLRAGGGHIVNIGPAAAVPGELAGTGIRLDTVDDPADALLRLLTGEHPVKSQM